MVGCQAHSEFERVSCCPAGPNPLLQSGLPNGIQVSLTVKHEQRESPRRLAHALGHQFHARVYCTKALDVFCLSILHLN